MGKRIILANKILGSLLVIVYAGVLIWWISGCTPVIQTRYIRQHLTHEPRPLLPKISGDELQCLSKATYQKLYDRQRLITGYAVILESIIDSTQTETQP